MWEIVERTKRHARSRRPSRALWAAGVGFLLTPAPVAASTEYLLADGPANGSLEGQGTSYDLFGELERSNRRFGQYFGEGGPLGRYLTEQFPRLDDFFSDAEVSLHLRSYYRRLKLPVTGFAPREAMAVGGAIGFRSGWWNDRLQIGVTGYTSQRLHGPADRGPTGLLTSGQGGISVLGELWAALKWEEFRFQGGRSEIDYPYLNRNDSRMIPQTFQTYGLYYEPHEGLTIGGGHTTHIKQRDSDEFISMSQAAGANADRGVTSVGALWKVEDCFDLAVFNHYGWDTFNITYAELQRYGPAGDLPFGWRIGLQLTDQRSVGDELLGSFSTQHVGVKFAAEFEDVVVTLAGSKTANGAGIRKPWGGSPSYMSSMIADFDRPGEVAVRLSASADLGQLADGLSVLASVAHGDPDGSAIDPRDQNELNLTLDYRPPPIEGLWLRVRGGWNQRGDDLTEDFRAIVNYELVF